MGEIGKLKKVFLLAALSLYEFSTILCSSNPSGVIERRKEMITMVRTAEDGMIKVSVESEVGSRISKLNSSFEENEKDFTDIKEILRNLTKDEIDLNKDWEVIVDYGKGSTQRPIRVPNNQPQAQPLTGGKGIGSGIWSLTSMFSSLFRVAKKEDSDTGKENPTTPEVNPTPPEEDRTASEINPAASEEDRTASEENDHVSVSINQGDLKFECDEKEKASEILNIVKLFTNETLGMNFWKK